MPGQPHPDGTLSTGIGPGHERFVLWPNRSLGSAGTVMLLATVAAGLSVPIVTVAGALAWPLILPAAGTFAGLAIALWRNNEAARFHEVIDVSARAIRIERIGPAASRRRVEFNPHWVRLSVDTDHYVENRLTLREGRRVYSVGEFLAPEERGSLAELLKERLRALRRPAP